MDLKNRVAGLNKFLSAVYETEMRLSLLLARIGFNTSEIEWLADYCAKELVDSCILSIKQRISAYSGGERLCNVISLRYGFDGEPLQTLQAIGDRIGVSRERVRQLEQKVLGRYRGRKNRGLIEASLKVVACDLLHHYENLNSPNDSVNLPEKVSDNPKKYVFSVEGDEEGKLYINIMKQAEKESGVIVYEEDISEFYQGLLQIVTEIGWRSYLKEYSLTEIRKTYPRAYEKWTAEEEKELQSLYVQGVEISQIAKSLGRQTGAIRSRLSKLGLPMSSTVNRKKVLKRRDQEMGAA